MKRVFYLITARGGSKGVPRKNIREINGLPLIAYKIIAAQKCKYEGRIIVSTDDKEIADIAKKYGAEVPFMRPDYLASDTASSMDVVSHAVEWLNNNDSEKYDYICLLEPSSPFTKASDLNNALDLITENNADVVLGMKEVEVAKCFIWPLDDNGKLSYFYNAIKNLSGMRRQDQKTEYTMNGCLYIAKTDYFLEHKLFHAENSLPYLMPVEQSVEIDSMNDYYYAKYCAENGLIDLSEWK